MTAESHTSGADRDTSVGLVACETCTHPVVEHSREAGMGCLHLVRAWTNVTSTCPCLRAGTSNADQ